MKKKTANILTLVLFLLIAVDSRKAIATSYLPAFFYHQNEISETVMKAGQVVYLFHSGTEDVKKVVHANDTLDVYRVSPSCEVKAVGKVKVLESIADTYFKSEVIEGEIRPHDIAEKGNASCLVISVRLCNPN